MDTTFGKAGSLKNHLLIAMPSLQDGVFDKSVCLICQHDEKGALGVNINQPLDHTVAELFSQLGFKSPQSESASQPALFGGPVQSEQGFVLHNAIDFSCETTLRVSDKISITASRDILEKITCDQGPAHFHLLLGYAGWGPNQLEHEIKRNSWLISDVDEELLFDTPFEARWEQALSQLGFDAAKLSQFGGNA